MAALKNKKKLRDLKIEGIDGKNLYININLNWYYKNLAAKCRRLKQTGMIQETWTPRGLVKIKLLDGKDVLVNHQSVLDELFPDFIYFDI